MNRFTIYVQKGYGDLPMKKNYDVPQKVDTFETGSPLLREQFSTCCRICHSVISREKLISPCLCKGSLAFVHLSCLERWLNQSGRDTCELCTFRFAAEQTRRYSVYQGLRIWYRHPRHMSQLRADLVIGLVLTGVTLGLCSICLGGMKYFVLEGFRVGISYVWTEGVISFFLTIIVVGYFTTIYLMLRDHFVNWYYWWSRCVNVRLILDMDMISGVEPQMMRMDSSVEAVENPSSPVTLPTVKAMRMEQDDLDHTNENTNAVIFIPDISSTSATSVTLPPSPPPPPHPPPPPPPTGPINTVPSILSAVMSHICSSINTATTIAMHRQQKCSQERADEAQQQKSNPLEAIVIENTESSATTRQVPVQSSIDSQTSTANTNPTRVNIESNEKL